MGTKRTWDGSASKKTTKPSGFHWSQGLLASMSDADSKVMEDDQVIVIKDKYPKAKFHYLVCAKKEITSLKQVRHKDLELLKHMAEVGENLCANHNGVTFLLGYHTVPSMGRLHLHVISDDFDSPCLKTKKHWNSFTTKFFVHSEEIIKQLESDKKITLMSVYESQKLINNPLKCHKCSYTPKHMPDLKHHINSHT